jgi:hypothetical protein
MNRLPQVVKIRLQPRRFVCPDTLACKKLVKLRGTAAPKNIVVG